MWICERVTRDEVVLSSLPPSAESLLMKRRLHLTLPYICYTKLTFKKFQLLCEHIISYFVCSGLSRANNIFSKSKFVLHGIPALRADFHSMQVAK